MLDTPMPDTPMPGTPMPARPGAVYVLGNQMSGNSVVVYDRAADGMLTMRGSYDTTGTGTGGALGSQGAVVLDEAEGYLYAVDAGSDTVTSFRVADDGLERVGTYASGGLTPNSVTVRGHRLYVLNSGGEGNLSGFDVDHGVLAALPKATVALSSDASTPAQVSFTPDGTHLVVTERATGHIDVVRLDGDGMPESTTVVVSAGAVPFGFGFDPAGHVLVSEAAMGTMSSYALDGDGLTPVSAAVPTTQKATCWVAVTGDGRHAYAGNAAGSLSISSLRVGPGGELALLDGRAATTAGGVTDLALSRDSRFLYSRLGDGTVGAFTVSGDGSLAALPAAPGLPAGAAGIAAR